LARRSGNLYVIVFMDDLCAELLYSAGGRFVRDPGEKSRSMTEDRRRQMKKATSRTLLDGMWG
jgi:hypothetical protein